MYNSSVAGAFIQCWCVSIAKLGSAVLVCALKSMQNLLRYHSLACLEQAMLLVTEQPGSPGHLSISFVAAVLCRMPWQTFETGFPLNLTGPWHNRPWHVL